MRHLVEKCEDCGVGVGELHDLFCLKERCPFCTGQLASCGCIRTVLALTEDETRALDAYIDDSVPPLSLIIKRWKDALDHKGRIPFEAFPDDPVRAAYRADRKAIERFLEDGFPINAGNQVGYTALMAAARGAHLDMIRFLLSRGARAALADKRGFTALHWVVAPPSSDSVRQAACLRALIDAGADPNASNENGVTPLMNAAWYGCDTSVRELLRCGSNPLMCDIKGNTAQKLALARGHIVLAQGL